MEKDLIMLTKPKKIVLIVLFYMMAQFINYSYSRQKRKKKFYYNFSKRLNYINGLVITNEELMNNGLIYFDYHSANFVAGNNIRFLDNDSIKPNTMANITRTNQYLIELMLSIL